MDGNNKKQGPKQCGILWERKVWDNLSMFDIRLGKRRYHVNLEITNRIPESLFKSDIKHYGLYRRYIEIRRQKYRRHYWVPPLHN